MGQEEIKFHATHQARGLYNTLQFVLRLSPEVHRLLATVPSGIHRGSIDFNVKQAFSTLLHETVHWWQHIGSSYGLMLSLSYPSQMQANYGHLKRLAGRIGFKKPLRKFIELEDGPSDPSTPLGLANIIVNNHFDIETFRLLSVFPKRVQQVIGDPLFECVGHAYQIAYGNNVLLLADSADPDFAVLGHPRDWIDGFDKLRTGQCEGFFNGSPVTLSPIGAYSIFEGQARFVQLQYLHFATGGHFDLPDAEVMGMLDGIYGEAFMAFLQAAKIDKPPSIDHPVIGLFLLVCDMAINPSSGFPGRLHHYATFIPDIDPGLRFLFLCRMIDMRCRHLINAVRSYSRSEYESVTGELANALLLDPPMDALIEIANWRQKSAGVNDLMEAYARFEFGERNTLVRVLFAHFVAFAEDKLRRPEFFCWPGAWMAGDRVSEESSVLFDRHGALFVDKPDDDGVFPRLRAGLDEAAIRPVFESFYSAIAMYDLTRQWITAQGSFTYDFRWLVQHGTHADMKIFADRHFRSAYGLDPDAAELLE